MGSNEDSTPDADRGCADDAASAREPHESWSDRLGRLSPVPARLYTPALPQQEPIDPPVNTREQLLPFQGLTWQNFERLCLRLARTRGEAQYADDHVDPGHDAGGSSVSTALAQGALYGTSGQDQQGIDLYVLLPPPTEPGSRYLTVQSRRIAKLSPKELADAVGDFLAGAWASVSGVFVYATSLNLTRTGLQNTVVLQRERLATHGIVFETWDAEYLSACLKREALIVDDFFGRAWAERFCDPDVVARLGERLDVHDVAKFRSGLARFYENVFDVGDSGLAMLTDASAAHRDVSARFVLPDLIVEQAVGRSSQTTEQPAGTPPGERAGDSRAASTAAVHSHAQLQRYGVGAPVLSYHQRLEVGAPAPARAATATVGTSVESWLASGERFVVMGGPGSGKSALLRYLVMDLLTSRPHLHRWVERFGDRLPVWLPFQYFAHRRASMSGAPASVEATLEAWLGEHDAAALWPLVAAALRDERLLLVVDGLDEAGDPDEGRSAAAALEVFLTQRNLPALVSTRPYGVGQLSLANRWSYASIAPLSTSRQIELARLWLDSQPSWRFAPEEGQPRRSTSAAPGAADSQVDEFIREVDGNSELRDLAQVPLFLMLLISLRLRGHPLPARRFDVYEQVIEQLLEKHPARRAVAASHRAQARLRPRDIRQTLARLAFDYQHQGVFGPVREQLVEAKVRTALQDPDYLALPPAQAAELARTFVEIAEGQIGVLVRQGPRHLGFLHRVLQEQLAAEYAAYHIDTDATRALFRARAADPRWTEVLLGILWRCDPETVETLIGVLSRAAGGKDTAALRARELVADAVFGDYGLGAVTATMHARPILDVIEQHPYLPHRTRLLSAALQGLHHPAIGPLIQERLRRWASPGEGLSPGGYYHLGRVCDDADSDDLVWSILRAGLAHDDVACARAAAIAIAQRYTAGPRQQAVRAELIDALAHPHSAEHAAMILISLCLGWPHDADVKAALATARLQHATPVRLVALAEVLGVLRPLLDDQCQPSELAGTVGTASAEDLAWLEEEASSEAHSRRPWIALYAEVTVTAAAQDPRDAARWRDWCIQTLHPDSHSPGDRAIAWAVLLRGHGQEPAVIDFVCSLLTGHMGLVHFLGVGPLARTYPDNERVAAAIEDAVGSEQPGWLSTELAEFVVIDHGPAIRRKLLANFAEHAFPHWPAAALAAHWPDDAEIQTALIDALDADPVRASQIAACVPRLLGPSRAIDRLLKLLDKRPADPGFRTDFIAYALIDACITLGETSGPTAERAAHACLQALTGSADMYEHAAEETVVARLSRTKAATARARQMLELEAPPFDALLAGYKHDPAMLTAILDKLRRAQPRQPTPVRLHLYTTLRSTPNAGVFVRELAQSWPLQPHALVRSAASAAYHHHLQRGRQRGEVPAEEVQRARQVIQREAVAWGLRPDSEENPGRRRSAWLGALLLEEPGLMDDLHDPLGPATVNLGTLLSEPDIILLNEIADRWPQLRAHFGDQLLHRLLGGTYNVNTGDVWEYLTQVADRNEDLAREADAAIAAKPELLREHDAILARYARQHSGQPGLLDLLINRLGQDHTNARPLESLLLAQPESIGFDTKTVADRIRSQTATTTPWGAHHIPGPALEVLAELDPDDPTVRAYWEEILEGREHSEPARWHPRTYFPIAYAAMAASQFLSEIDKDIEYTRVGFHRYFAPQHARSARLRISRDPDVLAMVEAAIISPTTPHNRATQLASLLVGAMPLGANAIQRLSERLHAQLDAQPPALVFDPVSGIDAPTSLLLLDILYTATR